MRNRFERQLLELNNELIQMGSMIERAIEMGISALVRQDVEKAKKAIATTRRSMSRKRPWSRSA